MHRTQSLLKVGVALAGLLTLQLAPAPASAASGGLGIAAVFNVHDFGATGNGVADDAPAIRAALAAAKAAGGGTVYVPSGVYLLASRPPGSGGFGLLQMIQFTNVEVVGDGPSSELKQQAKDWTTIREAHVFWCKACDNVSFRDMTVDGSRNEPGFVGQERMSGVYAFQSTNITVERVRFENVWGDGVQLVGTGPGPLNDPENPPVPVVLTEHVIVRDSVFVNNGRSGIGVQGSTRHMQLLDNHFEATSDQDIDFEPTGHRRGPEDVLIQGNTMVHLTAAFAVTLGGQTSLVPAKNIRFIDNVIQTGSIQLFNVDGALVEGNTIVNDATSPATPTVNAIGAVQNAEFRNNTLERRSPAGSVVQFAVHTTKRASGILFEDNEVRHVGGGSGIVFDQPGNDLVVRGNEVVGSGDALGINVDLAVGDGVTRTGVEISDNIVRNFDAAIQFRAVGTARFGVTTVCGNAISDDQPVPTQNIGIKLSLQDANSIAEAVVCNNTMGIGVVTPVTTNVVTRFRGTGSPEGVVKAPIGSVFIRTDEEDRRYDKVAGAGSTTGWVGA